MTQLKKTTAPARQGDMCIVSIDHLNHFYLPRKQGLQLVDLLAQSRRAVRIWDDGSSMSRFEFAQATDIQLQLTKPCDIKE